MSIPWHQFFKVGMRVDVQSGEREANGTITEIDETKVVLDNPLGVFSVERIVGMQVSSTAPTPPPNSSRERSASSQPTPRQTLANLLSDMRAAIENETPSPFNRQGLLTLIEEARGQDQTAHLALSRIRDSLDNAIRIGEVDKKFGRMPQLIHEARTLYSTHRLHGVALLIGLLYQTMTDASTTRRSCFSEGVETLFALGARNEAREFMIANGRLPFAIQSWHRFTDQPEVLVRVLMQGFAPSVASPFELLEAAIQVHEMAKAEMRTSQKNALIYAALLTMGHPEDLGDAEAGSAETTQRLISQLSSSYGRIRFAGATASTKDGHYAVWLEGPAIRILPITPRPGSLVQERMSEFEATIAGTAAVRTQSLPVAQDFLTDVQHALIRKRAATKIETAVLAWSNTKLLAIEGGSRPKANKRPSPGTNEKALWRAPERRPQRPGRPGTYATEVTSNLHKLGAHSAKTEFDAVESRLRSIAERPGPNQESAVMDLISFLTRKDVNKVDDALKVAKRHAPLFRGERRPKFLNMYAPLLVKACHYTEAIREYEKLLQLHPTRVALVHNRIAYCYLKQEDFANALRSALQAEHLSRDPIDHNPAIRTQVLASVGLQKTDDARASLARGEWLAEAVYSLLQEVIESAERGDDSSSSLSHSLYQEFELEAYDRDAIAFLVKWSPYLSSLLDANEYEGVNIRLQKDDGSFYVPGNHRKNVIGGLQEDIRRARRFGKEAYFRIQERCLSLACLYRDRANDTDDPDAEGSREGFIEYSARALIFKAMVYERHNALPDYLAMLYTESLSLLSRREGASDEAADEYWTCLNGLIVACVGGAGGSEMVNERYQNFLGHQQLDTSPDQYVAQTLEIAFSDAKESVLSGIVIAVANSGEAGGSLRDQFLGLLRKLDLEEEAKSTLHELFNLAQAEWTLERVFGECVSQARATWELIRSQLHALGTQIAAGPDTDPEPMLDALSRLKAVSQSRSVCYSDAERLRAIITVGEHALSVLAATDFSVAKESYDKAVSTLQATGQAIEVDPTKVSFELIGPMLVDLNMILDRLLNGRYQEALPRLTLSDDASDESYACLNNRIAVQLRLHNDGKTMASAVHLEFHEDIDTRRFYTVERQESNGLAISPGGSECLPVTLLLTDAGSAPDALMDLRVKAVYRTIRDEEKSVDFPTLSIGIQSDGAWTGSISNPYNSGTEMEPRSSEVLFGREGDILSITQQMANRTSRGDAVLIYGQYRCGKSSLKNYVVDSLMQQDDRLVVASLSAKSEWAYRDFTFNVLNEIRKGLGERGVPDLPALNVYDPSVQEAIRGAPREYLQDQLESVGKILDENDLRLLLVIDEFGRIFESKEIAETFMQYWKGLMALRVFKTITIAHDVITEQIRRNENVFAVFQARQLNYISQRATQALVQGPTYDGVRERDRILPDAVEYLWWLTAGQVWYLQMLCHQIVVDMNLYRFQTINRTRANDAVRAWAGSMASHDLEGKFHPMFRSGEGGDSVVGDDDAKSVLRAIAQAAEAVGGVRARRVDVLQKLQGLDLSPHGGGTLPERADEILSSLTARWVIDHYQESDSFEIRVKLYHEYLLGRL